MDNTLAKLKKVIAQISTPEGAGTGFYLSDYQLIVTNEHVVKNFTQVVVEMEGQSEVLLDVCYFDTLHDLAFIAVPPQTKLPSMSISDNIAVNEGDKVMALGHPYGLKFTATQGIVSKAKRLHNNLHYIQIDAAINPGNSGGPLINQNGEIIGINTFIIEGGDNLGFSLPIHYVKSVLDEYIPSKPKVCRRCDACTNLVFQETQTNNYCPYCGSEIHFPTEESVKENQNSIAQEIEKSLEMLEINVALARRGSNNWQLKQGSAIINISYVPMSGYIICDAVLCRLARSNIAALYAYLLAENMRTSPSFFSVNGQSIILSAVIFDKFFKQAHFTTLLEKLLYQADYYDDILVNEYACVWNDVEE
ncbi:MAG: trypsin-like peptidase domain-containing protein [Chitinophagales bacterium]|nr:trypsin-like peptidase domain-containing protein [Bacteroidota bacterium]MCB9043357.1 trypsin-like peptidase domain-containing protein [Chitinophagales bacterium]